MTLHGYRKLLYSRDYHYQYLVDNGYYDDAEAYLQLVMNVTNLMSIFNGHEDTTVS